MKASGVWVKIAVLAVALVAAAPCVAQGRGPGGGGPPGGGQGPSGPGGAGAPGGQGQMGAPGGFGAMNVGGRGGIPPAAGGGERSAGISANGSMQMGPVGRWWDDKSYASSLGIRPDQKKRMDAIFNGNRGELTEKVKTLRDAEAKLEATTQSGRVGSGSVFGEIDRVAAARDALEKVNLRLMESLNKELDAEQFARLQGMK